jgi:hypothetical protein
MSHLNHIPFCSSQCEDMQKNLENTWEMEESRTQNKILTQFEGNSVLPTPIAYAAYNIALLENKLNAAEIILNEFTKSPDSCFTVKRRAKMNAMDDKKQENEKSNESQEPKNKLSIKPLSSNYLEESFKEQAKNDGDKYEVTQSLVVEGYGVIAKRTIHKKEIIGPVFGKVVLMDKKERDGGMDQELFKAGWRRREIKIIKSEIEPLLSQFNSLWEESQQNKKSELYVIAHELSAMGRINSSQDGKGNQTGKANAKFELTPFTKQGKMNTLKKVCGDLCKIPPLFIYHVKAIKTINKGEEILINYGWSDSEQVDGEKEDGTESESSDQGEGNNKRLEPNGDSKRDEDEVEVEDEDEVEVEDEDKDEDESTEE